MKKTNCKLNRMPLYKRKLIMCILCPVLISVLLFSVLNFYLLNKVKKQMLNQCQLSHRNFSQNYDQELYELSQNSILLMDNQTFRSTYFNHSPIKSSENYVFTNLLHTLSSYVATKSYILQAGYINTVNNRYISSAYTAFLEDFYDNTYYGNIVNSKNYLEHYKKRGTRLQLQPLDVKNNQVAIPVLQYQIGGYLIDNPLIIYISKKAFSASLNNYKITDGTQLYIYSHETNEIIASTKSTTSEEELIPYLSTALAKDKKSLTIKGTKYYIFASHSTSVYCDPLVYVTLVPWNDIWKQITSSWLLSIVTLLSCCALTILLCYLFSFKLYSPIKGILSHFIFKTEPEPPIPAIIPQDELGYLDERIRNLMLSNKDLQDTMTNAIPTLYSRYILNILYQEDYDNVKLEPLLAKYSFRFPFSYFNCSILVPKYSPEFYSHFTKADQIIIKRQLVDVLSITQDPHCVKYVFKLEDEHFCIISNAPVNDHTNLITKDFNNLSSLFSFDSDYITLYLSAGKTCETIQNLHQSWKQANIALGQISSFHHTNLVFYSEATKDHDSYCMAAADDNRLSNYLFQGNKEAALELVTDILAENEENNVNENGYKNLYIHLYEIGDKLLRQITQDETDLLKNQYVNLATFIHNYTQLQRSDYIKLLYHTICTKQTENSMANHDLEVIKAYIDEHYCEDIYLESLATVFNTSPKYMSRILKQALGTPFKQYITTLKITKAKELLVETDLKIDTISSRVGFNSRISFIRSFKQTVGTTPSEYRNLSNPNT